MITELLCPGCNLVKPVEEFYKNRKDVLYPIQKKSDVSTHCKPCHSEIARQRYHDNPQWVSRDNSTRSLMYNYNMTLADYHEEMARQDDHCKICPATEPGNGKKRFCVDHDHACENGCIASKSCGECIRGLLCGRCNVGLGAFQDDPSLMLSAIAYLINDNDTYVLFLQQALDAVTQKAA